MFKPFEINFMPKPSFFQLVLDIQNKEAKEKFGLVPTLKARVPIADKQVEDGELEQAIENYSKLIMVSTLFLNYP